MAQTDKLRKIKLTVTVIHASPYFQQCASPDNYFYVDSADDFVSAVSEIAENVNQVVRLTK